MEDFVSVTKINSSILVSFTLSRLLLLYIYEKMERIAKEAWKSFPDSKVLRVDALANELMQQIQ